MGLGSQVLCRSPLDLNREHRRDIEANPDPTGIATLAPTTFDYGLRMVTFPSLISPANRVRIPGPAPRGTTSTVPSMPWYCCFLSGRRQQPAMAEGVY